MKYSKLFGKTSKTISKDATMVSHKLLLQAGYIAESVAGRYFILPLGMRVQDKIMEIIEEEMDRAGAQKMISPILHPLELWKETNRTNTTGFELMKVKDRRGAEFALGGTAEEMFVDVFRKYNMSYKDLPCNIYQFSTKFRDEMRARGGLLRVREFVMKDAYSFDRDEESFKLEYQKMAETYTRIFERMGLKTTMVLADNGYIGGEYCHEFVVDSEIGESTYFVTEDGSYAAHEEVAEFALEDINVDEEMKPLQVIDAVRGTTMEDGVKLHGLPMHMQIKDVMYKDDKGRYILAVLRGDLDVNEVKLSHLTGSITLEHASEEDIRTLLKSEPGFISPVGMKENMDSSVELLIVADRSLRTIKNAYGGANALNKDSLNVNIDRDYKADLEGDIAFAREGFKSISGSKLIARKGIEVGNIFQLGYHYSNLMKNAEFVDVDGKKKKYYMGCYGIGIGRTMAAVVEIMSDEKGIVWPIGISPYHVHLITLGSQDAVSKSDALYNNLIENGVEVLWDEREDVSAGAKFADADLIGIPIRIVVSDRSLEKGGYEFKERNSDTAEIVNEGDILGKVMGVVNKSL
ncbi:proline--tRNA ligase [Candidatus Dojkabacteria bacterium]|nr:proline--tRNA ligase [Candidatus Dojkabacteria bacterium]